MKRVILLLLMLLLISPVYAERYIVEGDGIREKFGEKVVDKIQDRISVSSQIAGVRVGIGDKEKFVVETSEEELISKGILDYELDYPVKALGDVLWNYQYIGFNFSDIPEGFGGGVKIAVLDTGVNYNFLDVASGYDFVNEDADAMDDNGHGTFVSQILKQPEDNFPLNDVEVYAVKILDSGGGGYVSDAIEGITWAVENNMDIVLMSFGGEEDSSFFQDILDLAYDNGILLIAASGNDGSDVKIYPAEYDSVISVGSINENLERSSFSNYGSSLEFVAPGENILVSDGVNQYVVAGTSFSVPHVGVVAGSYLSENLDLTNEEIRELMRNMSIDLGTEGRDDYFGEGLVRYDYEVRAMHKKIVHKYLSREAYYILERDIENQDMLDQFLYYLERPGGENDILDGAWDEDESGKNPWGYSMPYMRHFWDPITNNGFDASLCFLSCAYDGGICKNAYQIANQYWNGHGDFEGIKELYRQGKLTEAYYYLGHIAHLLEDMSVPAHVQLDPHGGICGGDDDYEEYLYYNYLNWNRGDVFEEVNTDQKFSELFLELATSTDKWPSDDRDGVLYSSPGEICSGENMWYCNSIQEDLMPKAMLYTASLYYLFWKETHFCAGGECCTNNIFKPTNTQPNSLIDYNFCSNNKAYQRDYSCSGNNATEQFTDNLLEECSEDEICSNGECTEFILGQAISPITNSIYSSRKILFNISAEEKLEKIEYIDYADGRPRWRTLCTKCDEYSRSRSFRDGEHNIFIRFNDYFGNQQEQEIEFFVDSKDPRISKTEPRRNRFGNGNFKVQITEENPELLILHYGDEEQEVNLDNCYEYRRRTYCETDVSLEDYDGREIDYYFTLEDIAGNVDESRISTIKVDTQDPILNNEESFWEQGDGRYQRYIYFNFNISEDNFDEVIYSYTDDRGRLRERRLCSRLRDDVCEKRVSFREGEYEVEINILDEAGNSIEKIIEFIVD